MVVNKHDCYLIFIARHVAVYSARGCTVDQMHVPFVYQLPMTKYREPIVASQPSRIQTVDAID